MADLKVYVKRVEKLLPPSIDDVKENTVENSKKLFYDLRRDTDRQRMAADVEIKVIVLFDICIFVNNIYNNLIGKRKIF